MEQLKHLFPRQTAAAEQYTYGKTVRGDFKTPPRDDRPSHGGQLIQDVKSASEEAKALADAKDPSRRPKGFVLAFESDPSFKLKLASLELRASGVELCSSRVDERGVMHATVFLPKGKEGLFIRKFEAYIKQLPGKPDNKELVASISRIRLATLKEFWMDAGPFPETAEPKWWEIWLRDITNPHDVADVFRERAQSAGVVVGPRELRFPERRVLLAFGTVEQLSQIENLFDLLAEIRLAKILAGEFLALAPPDQADYIENALTRVTPPPEDAAVVCHLDTGVNRGHPLIGLALHEDHVLAVEPNWSTADLKGHGTEMAGLALYGCLTEIWNHEDPILLTHRLESVKILPDVGQNDPDLYGDITSQAVSRIEIAAPERVRRAFCLTVTTDGRDEGYPSSWSAALDQICSASEEPDAPHRLIIVSAGNVPLEERHEYPERNGVSGIEDPAQSWNALTVGAATHRATIHDSTYEGWSRIAPPGRLSPCSRTSLIWGDQSWPLKPDIVMEGGNNAIDPSTNSADFVDDLSLLTTRVTPSGAVLTTTGDTSAAGALAARYAAMIWAGYPELTPESVRGLLVHSARWTKEMCEEFPDRERHNRLRCYGYGIPDLQSALWSASNAATLIVQNSLQPFHRVEGKVKTKDMHLHDLPWPKAVLQELGELPVRMRITLSYFIEPSPGRRGWTRKHRYQSHGLRFDVRWPSETIERFRKRISKAARDDDDETNSFGSDPRDWEIGEQLRCKGSVHSDIWCGTAVELAESGVIAVFPVTGWWKERAHLNRWDRQARYSLIISIETDAADVDLYTPIANQIGLAGETEIDT